MDIILFRCTQCGAVLEINDGIEKYRCRYCGAHYIRKERERDQNAQAEGNLSRQTEGKRITAFTVAKEFEKAAEGKYCETAEFKRPDMASTSEVKIFEASLDKYALKRDERNRHLDTWARHIRGTTDYERIPQDLRFVYESDIGQNRFNPDIYLLYCPSNERDSKILSPKLLYIFNFSLICIEREYGKVILKRFRVDDIKVMEIGSVLLDGWITITGKIGYESEKISVSYNDVKGFLFERLIEMLRTLALGMANPPKCDIRLTKGKSFGRGLFIEYGLTKIFSFTYNS